MKFILSNTTVVNTNVRLANELKPIAEMFGAEGRAIISAMQQEGMREITHLKNVSLTQVNGEWIFEVNDELMFKHISLIGKVVRFIAPIAMSVKLFAAELKAETQAIEAWTNEEK